MQKCNNFFQKNYKSYLLLLMYNGIGIYIFIFIFHT
jgi:hypothetical protein